MADERNIRIVVIFDPNVRESRELMMEIAESTAIDRIEVQRVRSILPGIRATPAVGVLVWSNDLQGLVADVEDFAAYVKGEYAIKAASYDAQRYIPDEVALEQPRAIVMEWVAGAEYRKDTKLYYKDTLYNVEQDLTSSESSPPDAEGVLALYRPIVPGHAGTQDDPIPWIYGMDCVEGLYYLHNGTIYKALQSMAPCTWEPGAAGTETIWEAVQ